MTFTFTPKSKRTGKSAAASASEPIITCAGKVNYPHASTHVPGSVNVTSSVTCDGTVAKIVLTTKLWQRFDDVYEVVGRQTVTAYDTISLKGNAATPNCVNIQYYGTTSSTITAPPGYVPTTQTHSAASPYVTISCP